MSALRRFLRRLFATLSGRSDGRMKEELDAHLQMQVAENLRAGMSPATAQRQALLALGPVGSIEDACRDEQRLPLLDELFQNIRDAARQIRKSPAFTLTAVVSLAAGIGANAAVFTVADRLLLRPLPVDRPHELVLITDDRILTTPNVRFSYPFFALLRENRVLAGVAAHFGLGVNAAIAGRSVRASAELVSGNFFGVLGAGTQAGRPLSPDDDRTPGAHPVAVIGDRFWRGVLGADPAVVGRTLTVNDRQFTIVGVAAREFTGTAAGSTTDIWVPLSMQRELGRDLVTDARTNWLELIGRRRADQPLDLAAAALDAYLQQRAGDLPAAATARRLILLPGARGGATLRGELESVLVVLFSLTTLALILACVNVACLAAVRSAGREKELAVRLALGAQRARLYRQLLTEGIVLAAVAAVAGALMAPWIARALVASRSLAIDAEIDVRTFAFIVAISLLAGAAIALLPMLTARRAADQPARAASWTMAGGAPRRGLAIDAIVALQIGLALSMLICAALLVQSLRSFASIDPGFRVDNLVLATLDPEAAGYDSSRVGDFWSATLARVRRLPAVERVSLAGTVPLSPVRQRQPWRHPATGEGLDLDTNFVGPDYFAALEIPLIAGRDFTDGDRPGAQVVVIVNERAGRLFWPGDDPVGKGLRLPDSGNPIAQVVGVVRDVQYQDLRGEALPMVYRPVLQTRSTDEMTLHVRTSADADALLAALRLAIQEIDPDVGIFGATTLDAQMEASFASTRHAAWLTSAFGLLALLLSGVGVCGVTALATSRRRRDIALRIALGARRVDIVRTVGARSAAIVAIGLAIGTVGAFAIARLTGTLLFGVTSGNAPTFASMAAVLAVVSLVACAVPLRAATRMDPLAAIRHE